MADTAEGTSEEKEKSMQHMESMLEVLFDQMTRKSIELDGKLKEAKERLKEYAVFDNLIEESLRKSESRYRLLVDSMNEGVLITTQSGFVKYANETVANMIETERTSLLGESIFRAIGDENLKRLKRVLIRVRRESHKHHDFVYKKSNDKKIYVSLSVNFIYDKKGEVQEVFAVITDITARKRHEAQLKQSRKREMQARKKTERLLHHFLLALSSAIESRDKYTAEHVERVASFAREIGKCIGLSKMKLKEIYLGAIVHDVGKINISDAILNKPGRLTPTEIDEMKLHPAIGKKLLDNIEGLDTAVRIVYCHQEKWDGTGYPLGLKGESIPLEARIVTVADYWDAITSDRPYRKAMPISRALAIMEEERGKALDPKLLDIFLDEKHKIYLRFLPEGKQKEYGEGTSKKTGL